MDDAIDSYVPTLRTDRWEPIADFVREAVRDCELRTVYTARNLLATSSKYVDWCYRVCGTELTREAIFRPALIAEWSDKVIEGVERSTAGNYRSRLLRMQEVLNPRTFRPKMVPIPSSKGIDPYSEAEERQIWVWAYALGKPRNSRDAIVLVAGCVGAGLTAREVCDLRASDVIVDDNGVLLNVTGTRPRVVPTLSSVEQIFIDAVNGLAPDDFVFRPGRSETLKNTSSLFIHKYTRPSRPVSTQRLRATWVIGHLRRGVPIQALMKAMGVQDFSAIARYLKDVPDLDEAEFRARLRAEHEGNA